MASTLKSVSVYQRRGFYFVHPLAGSQGGDPALFIGPVLKLEEGADAAALGEAVLQSLKASHHNQPWPTSWKGLTQPLLDAAGVKSESTFMKSAKGVRVNLDQGVLQLLPSTSKDQANAGAPLMDQQIFLPLTDARSVGDAVLKALAVSD